MKGIDEASDRELVRCAKNGDDVAFAEISKRYEALVTSMTERYIGSISGAEFEDLKQESGMALYRAVIGYDLSQSSVTFGLYAKVCIRNRLISIFRKSMARSRRAKAETLKRGGTQSGQTVTAGSKRKGMTVQDRESVKELADAILTEYEKTVFYMYLDGKPYTDISAAVGKTVKSVDNAIFRAKRKLRNGYSRYR